MNVTVSHYQSEHWDLHISKSYGNMVLEGFVKTGDTLKHLVWQVDDAELTAALDLTREYGRPVQRPYVVGQGCDGSITVPVFALFLDFCRSYQLDASALYAKAYNPDRSSPKPSPNLPTGRASQSPIPGQARATWVCWNY